MVSDLSTARRREIYGAGGWVASNTDLACHRTDRRTVSNRSAGACPAAWDRYEHSGDRAFAAHLFGAKGAAQFSSTPSSRSERTTGPSPPSLSPENAHPFGTSLMGPR
jgi:hypothetical protein